MNTIYRLISTIIDLTSLDRYGKQSSSTYGKIDDLTCSYDGNHLTAISDNAPTPTISGSFDFKDSTGVSTEYLYDANGNMTKDANKGITQILYNHLNRPSRIAMVKGSSTSTIDYVYSASGAKLRVIHRPNVMSPLSTTTDYINGYIFTNNSLSMALTDNGYYTLSSTGDPTYYFYLKDHQGNNRVVVAENDSIVQTNHYYPYGALFAESTNGDVQRFKYNGKELDRKFGLNWYDHGARHNDAAIGRWHSMDPMAEKYYGISPYAYCGGDPVNLGDYDGMDIYEFDTLGRLTITENKIIDLVCVKGVNEVLIYRYGSITHFEDDGYYTDSETNTQTKAHFNCMKISGDKGDDIFEYLSENTNVEFGQIKTTNTNGKKVDFVSTIGSTNRGPNILVISYGQFNPYNVYEINHSHPSNFPPSEADYEFAKYISDTFGLGETVSFGVYKKIDKEYERLDLQNNPYVGKMIKEIIVYPN